MRLQTKIFFTISAALFIAFLFFVSDKGQEILRGPIPKDATGFQLDDVYMGAGIAPWAYLLFPSFVFMLLGLGSLSFDRKSKQSIKLE